MMADDVYQAYVSDYHPGRSLREEFEAVGRIFLTGMFTERAVGACRLVFAQSFASRDIGEFFYRLGPVGAPVQLGLLLSAGYTGSAAATVYTWKAVANTVVYTVYAVAALLARL